MAISLNPVTSKFELAVLSDIHGNRWALEAVLKDIQERGIVNIVNLGDSLFGPLDPAGTADMLIKLNLPTVLGNEDRILIEERNHASTPSLQYTLSQLNLSHQQWLSGLPKTRVYEDFFLCHGTPKHDDDYLTFKVSPDGLEPRPVDELLEVVADVGQHVILCGHDHTPRTLHLPNGKRIVNPGSVGLQAYWDEKPFTHEMETGDPLARYSIITHEHTEWNIQNIRLSYDYEAAATVAQKNGRPDWGWLAANRMCIANIIDP